MIQKILRYLLVQTAGAQIELILVTTAAGKRSIDLKGIEAFSFVKIVVRESIPTGATGWTAGVRAASGRIVVMAEDHSYPETNWAERLIAAHENDWAVVRPRIENGNPATLTSWRICRCALSNGTEFQIAGKQGAERATIRVTSESS